MGLEKFKRIGKDPALAIAGGLLVGFNLFGMSPLGAQESSRRDQAEWLTSASDSFDADSVLEISQHNLERSVLGVVTNTANNSPAQQQLREHLEAVGIPFRILETKELAQSSVLNRYTFLFLANVTELSSAEVDGLSDWLQRGGRLILSGPIATESSQGVRQSLNRALGVYWDNYTDRSQAPQLAASVDWMPSDRAFPEFAGGILVPTQPGSQVLLTWQNKQEAAVVASDRLVFLGWDWGNNEATAALDQAWLLASFDRFNKFPAQRSNTATAISPRPAPATSANSPRPPLVPRNAANFDPSQEVAPPGLDVRDGNDPIVFLEAIAMRDELTHLLGRFQNAHLSLNLAKHLPLPSISQLFRLPVQPSTVNVALNCNENTSNCRLQTASATVPPLVNTVQNTLKRFPSIVAEQDYSLARREWLNARNSIWDNYPDSQPHASEIRAVWLDRGTIVEAGSPERLEVLFDQLATAGINVVFFETLNAGYTIYPSTIAPAQNPLTVGWDPLAVAIDLAHQRNMELHAWIWTFAAGNQAHNRILGQPEDYLGPVLSQHPDWVNRDNRGRIWSAGKPFFDPAHPGVRSYLHSLIAEISDRYAVDGIQLDYIRYPFQDIGGGSTFGYGKAGREQFKQLTTVDPVTLNPQHPLWEEWQNFRIRQVDSFVASVGEDLRRYHPHIKLSVAVFAFPTHERLAKIQQNWELWARRGDIDMVCLMAYAMDTNRFEQLTDPWLSSTDLGGTLIMSGIHLLSLPEMPAVLDQIQFLRDQATTGYVLFATAQFQEKLQQRFRSAPPEHAILPHRAPLESAYLRYSGLQQEWDWLLAQGQLSLAEQQREGWQTARQNLDRTLREAARMPNRQNLQRARLELEQFQRELPTWLRDYEIQNGYQVETWQNRLSVLTILLDYGERMLTQSRPLAGLVSGSSLARGF